MLLMVCHYREELPPCNAGAHVGLRHWGTENYEKAPQMHKCSALPIVVVVVVVWEWLTATAMGKISQHCMH